MKSNILADRNILFAILLLNHSDKSWIAKKYSDGGKDTNGMFIGGLTVNKNNIVYHLPMSMWKDLKSVNIKVKRKVPSNWTRLYQVRTLALQEHLDEMILNRKKSVKREKEIKDSYANLVNSIKKEYPKMKVTLNFDEEENLYEISVDNKRVENTKKFKIITGRLIRDMWLKDIFNFYIDYSKN